MTANIEKAQYWQIENDKTDPSYSTIEKIAKAMGFYSIIYGMATKQKLKQTLSNALSL